MTTFVSSAAHAASKSLASTGQAPSRSQISEVLAALLGYQTYAALVLEEADATLTHHLDDAEIWVLDRHSAEKRANAMGIAAGPAVVQACIDALKDAVEPDISVFVGVDDFYDSHGREALADAISNSDEVSGAMAETNAYFPDNPELPDATPATEDLWAARTEWSIEAQGKMHGEYDPEGDRMFNGDTLNCFGKLSYAKAGRAGLYETNVEGYAGVDDSWRDEDRDSEAEYMASLQAK